MRYTQKYAEGWFRMLAACLGKDVAEGNNFYKVGAWELDYNALYGGAIINEICNPGRGITHPLTSYRLRPREFGIMCQAIINSQESLDIANA